MKFSPSVCVAVVVSLTREVAVRSFAYHAHGTAAVIHGHDKKIKSAMHARSGSPLDDNHLTSFSVWMLYAQDAVWPFGQSMLHQVHWVDWDDSD